MVSAAEEKALVRVRALCMELPEVTEKISHGTQAWFIRDKKGFCSFHYNHHRDGILGIWCAAPPGAQEALIGADPERYYRPAYVGPRGWVGMRLNKRVNWDEVAGVIEDAYCTVAPAKLVALVR